MNRGSYKGKKILTHFFFLSSDALHWIIKKRILLCTLLCGLSAFVQGFEENTDITLNHSAELEESLFETVSLRIFAARAKTSASWHTLQLWTKRKSNVSFDYFHPYCVHTQSGLLPQLKQEAVGSEESFVRLVVEISTVTEVTCVCIVKKQSKPSSLCISLDI